MTSERQLALECYDYGFSAFLLCVSGTRAAKCVIRSCSAEIGKVGDVFSRYHAQIIKVVVVISNPATKFTKVGIMISHCPDYIPCSSFATELAVAVGPFTSLPDAGPIPSARGVYASLPSGVAPVLAPSGTLADTG